MNKENFNSLPLMEKAEYLWENGVYLDRREDEHRAYMLYTLGRKYYELIYVRMDNKLVQVLEADPYDVGDNYVKGNQ